MLTEVVELSGPVMMINLSQMRHSTRLLLPVTMRNGMHDPAVII